MEHRYLPGQIIYDRNAISQLPEGTIIAWSEDDQEEIGILRFMATGEVDVHNTRTYWAFETWIVGLPFRIVRLGKGKGELC